MSTHDILPTRPEPSARPEYKPLVKLNRRQWCALGIFLGLLAGIYTAVLATRPVRANVWASDLAKATGLGSADDINLLSVDCSRVGSLLVFAKESDSAAASNISDACWNSCCLTLLAAFFTAFPLM